MNYQKDYYTILGVDEKATAEDIRAGYRHLAKVYHPDKNPGDPLAEDRFKEINEAYEVLSNEITRHVYDSYRTENKQTVNQSNDTAGSEADSPQKPVTKTKTRTNKVTKEKRVYVQGTIEVKFQGEPEVANSYKGKWEQQFAIFPTEIMVTLTSSSIYTTSPPKEYQAGYSTAALFATPLKQPISCRVQTGDQVEYYQLDLYDIRVKDPILKDITKHDEYSFGTLQGQLFGYALYQYEENVTEQYTEYTGATGHVETKNEAGNVFLRQQFYTPDGGTYWTDWKRDAKYERSGHTNPRDRQKPIRKGQTDYSYWPWLVLLIILIIIIIAWPPFLYAVLAIAGWMLLLFLTSLIVAEFRRIMPFLCVLLIGTIVFLAIRSFSQKTGHKYQRPPKNSHQTISSTRTDSLITHTLQWQDRDSSQYQISIAVSRSAILRSNAAHTQMEEQEYASLGIGAVYRSMLNTDQTYLAPIASAFDSLARSRSLNRQQEASMIVSCIQSIPYSLIVDRSCTANYSDDYINQLLANCEGDCCKGYSKFGVQSPVEFIADLKGDCDTRALLLYGILTKLNYRTALMTSNYYKHALIAVDLDRVPSDTDVAVRIKGTPFYFWETTAAGFGPGKVPEAISNINHWNIALIK